MSSLLGFTPKNLPSILTGCLTCTVSDVGWVVRTHFLCFLLLGWMGKGEIYAKTCRLLCTNWEEDMRRDAESIISPFMHTIWDYLYHDNLNEILIFETNVSSSLLT